MRRAYKFRAWWYGQRKFDYNLTFEKIGKSYSMPLHWCDIQQWTGLLDMTGQEVYEGDILEFFNFDNSRYKIDSVIFKNATFCFVNQ
mgnify:CR=1 FL=1